MTKLCRSRVAPRMAAAAILLASIAHGASGQDTSFAAMQQRGKLAMGVDQYASVHHFDDRPDGGRIQLQSERDDPTAIKAIRAHLRGIAKSFGRGDFSQPEFVHMKAVPGVAVMAERRAVIAYAFSEVSRGGALRMTTADVAARRAIHEFLAFQRGEHHAAGHSMHDGMDQVRAP